MAKLSVSVDVPLPPEKAWEAASDLSRYKEWLTIHRVWRSTLPDTLEKGTKLASVVEVKGMLNLVRWTIVSYKPPQSLTLDGDGKGGVKVKLIGRVKPADERGDQLHRHLRRAPGWARAVRPDRDDRRQLAEG